MNTKVYHILSDINEDNEYIYTTFQWIHSRPNEPYRASTKKKSGRTIESINKIVRENQVFCTSLVKIVNPGTFLKIV